MIGQCFLPLYSTAVCGAGTLDEPLRTLDLVYFVHPSVEYRSALSADMSVDVSAKYRSILDSHIGGHVDRHVSRQSTDISTGQYTGRHSADTGSVSCRWNIGQLSLEYRTTIGGISVDCSTIHV